MLNVVYPLFWGGGQMFNSQLLKKDKSVNLHAHHEPPQCQHPLTWKTQMCPPFLSHCWMNRRLFLVFCFGPSMSWEYVRRHIYIYTYYTMFIQERLTLFYSNPTTFLWHRNGPQSSRPKTERTEGGDDGLINISFRNLYSRLLLNFNLEGWKGVWGKTNIAPEDSLFEKEHHLPNRQFGGKPTALGPEKWWNMYPNKKSEG